MTDDPRPIYLVIERRSLSGWGTVYVGDLYRMSELQAARLKQLYPDLMRGPVDFDDAAYPPKELPPDYIPS
jgi:hypothetical protein